MKEGDQFETVRRFCGRECYTADEVAAGHSTWHDRVIAGRLGESDCRRRA